MPLDQINSILTRYQSSYIRHVGAYDKAKWEQSIEERILNGIAHISTKSAKLGTDLIDLDLVQGSSFPKAKPKHGLFTVTRHALLRFIFLPFYHEWWSSQTSQTLYIIFIVLYIAQVLNLFLYVTQPTPSSTTNVTVPYGPEAESASQQTGPLPVQTSDILCPFVLMFILTILHSQIVSTHWSAFRRGVTPPPTATTSRSPRREPKSKRRNSVGSKPSRKIRRSSRHPASRRRGNTLPPISFVLGPPIEFDQEHLAPPPRVSASSSSLSPSTSKKVLFLDESGHNVKSVSPSNSDKDEGIPEEIGHEHEDVLLHEECNFAMTVINNSIIKKNLAHTVSQYVEEQNRCLGMSNGNGALGAAHGQSNAATLVANASLRKRNFSKQSVSTTTPSASGGDCSSGNNSCTDEENDDLEEEEADDKLSEDPRPPNGIVDDDDEEVRKSEWTAVTTNSEDEDYVEEEGNYSEDADEPSEAQIHDDPFAWEFQKHFGKPISPSCAASDKVSCTIWEGQEAKKADLTVLDISALIIAKVERARENSDYLYLGICFSILLAILPGCWRLNNTGNFEIDDFDIFKTSQYICDAISVACGHDFRTRVMLVISGIERLALSLCVFFLLAVAEKTYKQRFLYSKLFSRITSTRKSKKSNIPHFRLNKVRNIKTWLSIRSYLQRRGPQRSVDTIVSATFIATLILICFISVELLKESSRLYYLYNLEVIGWTLCLGFYLMRFMTLGSRISQKYRNLSVIITEQLNLYLKMEQKPHKKEELLVANNVLKLASELLKELEDPFKISSFASNPYFYNVTRLVILSAFSGVISEILGFKLKLYKIKLK